MLCKRSVLFMKKIAFTLAEIMIVLSVIAIITAILLPSARNAIPNEKVMKFKKGHNALYNAILELVNSDKYYLDGDLGTKADGTQLLQTQETYYKYFCETLADVLSIKSVVCNSKSSVAGIIILLEGCTATGTRDAYLNCRGLQNSPEYMQNRKERLDSLCAMADENNKEIITTDNVWYFDLNPEATFGASINDVFSERIFSPPSQNPPTLYESNEMDAAYKVFCMDIDGINNGEAPFGYGIRADGKILNGARADEWLNKSIHEKE